MDSLDKYIKDRYKDETFVKMMFRLMKERDLTSSDICKRANIDHKYFSKLNTNPDYKPSKKNVCALAIALHLDNATAKQLIKKAGYILTSASKLDLVLRFCFENEIYDIHKINELLYDQGLTTLYISY